MYERGRKDILKRGLEIGLGRAEYAPDGEVTATQLSGAGQVASVNQEAHLFRGGWFTIPVHSTTLDL